MVGAKSRLDWVEEKMTGEDKETVYIYNSGQEIINERRDKSNWKMFVHGFGFFFFKLRLEPI